jgi:signal peptidase I
MRVISFNEKDIEAIKNHLKENDFIHLVKISSEYGKYKKGEFVKSSWGEKFIVVDIIQIKTFEKFKEEYIHYKELKNMDISKVEKMINYKKIEILKLKKNYNKKL